MTVKTAAALSLPERQAVLLRTRRLKMARSAHAYVRGSTSQFYDWLATTPAQVPDGPPVWICGDCHVGNLGPLADRKGRVTVQIRDLDQTVIGNPAHDLIRLSLSLASAVRGSDLPGVATARMLETLMTGYQAALEWTERDDRSSKPPAAIRGLLAQSIRRRWPELAQERLKARGDRIPLGKRFWPLDPSEREGIAALLKTLSSEALVADAGRRGAEAAIDLVDGAYWMKGCSSLGRVRYAALVRTGSGKHASSRLVDIKEAVKAAAPRSTDATMPKNNADRVVAGARALSPNLGDRMWAGRLGDKAVTLRELAPQDLKIELARTTPTEAAALAGYLGEVVGAAHGRQMTPDQRRDWSAMLARGATRSLEAPTWLWSSVVELLGLHEAAYLEHCRQYALADAA